MRSRKIGTLRIVDTSDCYDVKAPTATLIAHFYLVLIWY